MFNIALIFFWTQDSKQIAMDIYSIKLFRNAK